jgi:hypothetical protein
MEDTEVTEDDVLQPVAGILDVLDNYAFFAPRATCPARTMCTFPFRWFAATVCARATP